MVTGETSREAGTAVPSRRREPRTGPAVGAHGRHHGSARPTHLGSCHPRLSCKLRAKGVSRDHCDCYTLLLSVIACCYFVISVELWRKHICSTVVAACVAARSSGESSSQGLCPPCSGLGPTWGWTGGVWTPEAAEPNVQLCLSPGVPITSMVLLCGHTSWWHHCPRANHCASSETGAGLRVSMVCGVHLCACVSVPMHVCLCVLLVHGWACVYECAHLRMCLCVPHTFG